MSEKELNNEQLEQEVNLEGGEELAPPSDDDFVILEDEEFVELDDDELDAISGGTSQPWIMDPSDKMHYRGYFVKKKVWHVKKVEGTFSALTLRREPNQATSYIIQGYYWQNGNDIYVNNYYHSNGWCFCYHHRKGAYGYVKSYYIH